MRPLAVSCAGEYFFLGLLGQLNDLEEVTTIKIQMRLADRDMAVYAVHTDVVDADLIPWTVAIAGARCPWRHDGDFSKSVEKWTVSDTAFIPLYHPSD